MNLPFIKKKPDQPTREYLFALEINSSSVKSAVWSVINDKTQVLSVGLVAAWDNLTPDSLLQAADTSLSDAAVKLDAAGKIQPSKIILGVPSDWVSEEKIRSEKLKLLKHVLQKLSLTAVGFVVTSEAALRFIQYSEGVPPTAILIGIWENFLEITLVRLGKNQGTHLIHRSSKIVADVTEGLTRFSHIDMFPSRILLYDSGLSLENIRQTLLAHPWQAPQTKLPFLHFPKVELLPSDFSIRAIALSGGDEVARAIGLLTSDTLAEPGTPPAVSPPPPAMAPLPDYSSAPVPEEEVFESDPVGLGFIPESHLPDLPPPEIPEVSEAVLPPTPTPLPPPEVPEITESQYTATTVPPTSLRPSFRFHLPHLPHLTFPRLKLPASPAFLIFGLVILSGAGLLWAYWNLPKATVTLTVVPKTLQHQFTLSVVPAATLSLDQSIIPAKKIEVNVNGEKSTATTGTKLIGDKASGTVTVINGTSAVRTFPAGTTITAPDGQKFTFDAEVKIASASGTADPNSYQPGKADVKVTAATIGSAGNLSAGTQFKVGSFSSLDYVAKNEAAFSGGSSRQAQAVSRDDYAQLRTDLTAALKDQALTQLTGQISSDDTVISPTIQLTTVSEDFTRKIDEVADDIGLKLAVKATALSYTKADLQQLVASRIASQVPADYLLQSDPESDLSLTKIDKTSASFNVTVKAFLLPKLDKAQIAKDIHGKTPEIAKNYLQNLPGISQIDYLFTPPLPGPLLTLPRRPDHITITVKPAL